MRPTDAELCVGDAARTPRAVASAGRQGAARRTARRFRSRRRSRASTRRRVRTYTLIVRDVSDRVAQEEALQRQAQSLAESAEELKQLNEELHRRQFELERAMTARSRFYASMSHELRTPINAVLGYSTLLLERIYGPLNDKQAEGIERTQKAARHLLELVNDVLDLSKIEAGKIDLRLQPVEFPALIEDLFVTVRPLADEHGSALTLEQTADEPIKIISDPRRLRQILLNLLSNAIKFGRGRPIRSRAPRPSDGGVAVIAVTDQGDGISDEDQERIFQEFVQLGKTQLQDGTGLGLPISRRLAELLRGSLTVESTLGEGEHVLSATAAERRSGASTVIACRASRRACASTASSAKSRIRNSVARRLVLGGSAGRSPAITKRLFGHSACQARATRSVGSHAVGSPAPARRSAGTFSP